MTISLNIIVASLVAIIAVIVAATCVVLSLLTSLDQIDTVGQQWAESMNKGSAELTLDYITRAENALLATSDFAKTFAPMLPSDLKAATGRNWTDIWIPFIQKEGAKLSYDFPSFSILFEDVYWTFIAESDVTPGTVKIDWFETLDPSQPLVQTIGGIRFWASNGSIDPFTASENFQAESANFNIFTRPMSVGDFNNVRNPLKRQAQNAGDLTGKYLLWLAPNFGWYPHKQIFWEQFGASAINNQTGHTIGHVLISLGLDKQFTSILSSAPRSRNGETFIIDKDGYLLSTTLATSFYTVENVSSYTVAAPNGCGTTASQPLLAQPRMGCRSLFNEFAAYPPMLGLTKDFALTATTETQLVTSGGQEYIVVARRFQTINLLRFNLVSFTPKDDLREGVQDGVNLAIGIACAIVIIAVALAVIVTMYTLGPLTELAEKMTRTARLEGLDKEEFLGDDAASEQTSGAESVAGDRASVALKNVNLESASAISEIATLEAAYIVNHSALVSFTRYVPKNVVKELMNAGDADTMSMHSTTITCSFADIKSFTSICEALQPKQLSEMLHMYFKKMTRLVMAHGGIIDRFIGDCIMAVWGAPFKVARHELLGALCALASQREAARNPLKQKFLESGFKLAVRIGVASGSVLAGNIGSSKRVAYTVMGDAVQTANSLEPYNKQWGTMVMVGEEVARECNEELVLRLLTRAKLTGRAKPLLCYELMGTQADARLKRRRGSKSKDGDLAEEGSDSSGRSSGQNDTSGFSILSPDTGSLDLSSDSDNLTTTTSDSEDSGNELLPENVNLEQLLRWHKKRTFVEENVCVFAAQFSEAARLMIDKDFPGALKQLKNIEEDDWLPMYWKAHNSVYVMKDLIDKAMNGHPSICMAGTPHSSPKSLKEVNLQQMESEQDFYVRVAE